MFEKLFSRPASPESRYAVTVVGDTLLCTGPAGDLNEIGFDEIAAVHVETNSSGPWGIDVWWVLTKRSGVAFVFPLGARGDDDALTFLRRLPGFEVRGMNSTDNARFECWPDPA